MLLKAVLIACFACFVKATQVQQEISTRIQNGYNTKQGEVSYMVSLQLIEDSFHFCGGSILNKDYVLTAAHCINNTMVDLNPERIKVTTGFNRSQPVSVHSVTWMLKHEKYVAKDAYVNDIALLKINPPFVFDGLVSTVKLPEINFEVEEGEEALIAGWGSTVTKIFTTPKTRPKILQKLTLSIGGDSYCKEKYMPIHWEISATHLCTIIPAGLYSSACKGDSGGPLTIDEKTIVGIASTSPQNDIHCSAYPTVYTKVSKYIDWISNNTIGLFNNENRRISQYPQDQDHIIFPNN